jgi:hypothetical protein
MFIDEAWKRLIKLSWMWEVMLEVSPKEREQILLFIEVKKKRILESSKIIIELS